MFVQITAAQIFGNFFEAVFFGLYLVTCGFCARTLLITGHGQEERWFRASEIRWIMAIVAVALFLVLTFDVAIGLLHNFNAFVKSKNAEKELLNISDWINITRTVNQIIAMMLVDFILIYRCWIVHGRRWRVVVPSLVIYLCSLGVSAWVIQGQAQVADPKVTLTAKAFTASFIAFYAVTGVQNILTTSMLIWRIWRVEKESEKCIYENSSMVNQPHQLRRAIRIIAESGALYTLSVFITIIMRTTGSNVIYPATDVTLQLTGIAFNLILIRAQAKREKQFTDFDNSQVIFRSGGQHTAIMSATVGSVRSIIPGQGRAWDATHLDNNVDNQAVRVEVENPLGNVPIADVKTL